MDRSARNQQDAIREEYRPRFTAVERLIKRYAGDRSPVGMMNWQHMVDRKCELEKGEKDLIAACWANFDRLWGR